MFVGSIILKLALFFNQEFGFEQNSSFGYGRGMTKTESTYAHKFQELSAWYPQIFTSVKNDLRDEHLKIDKGFLKRNFPGKAPNKLTVEDLIRVYSKFIAQGYEELSEFIANRWLLRHLDIYNFFEECLKKSYEHFDQIAVLDDSIARPLLQEAIAKFGAVDTYIFSQLNAVAFSAALMQELKEHAAKSTATA